WRPRAAARGKSATTTSATPTPSRHGLPSLTFGTCIVPPPFVPSARVLFDPRGDACRRRSRPQKASEQRRDPVSRDQHPDDDRRAENDELHSCRKAANEQHLVQ